MAGWLESTTGIPSRGRSTGRRAGAWLATAGEAIASSVNRVSAAERISFLREANTVNAAAKTIVTLGFMALRSGYLSFGASGAGSGR